MSHMNGSTRHEDAVAAELLEQYGESVAAAGQPLCVEVRQRDGRLESRRESSGWLGRSHHDDWDAAALVATGRVRVAHPSVEPPACLVPALGGGLCLACVVWRSGTIGWSMTLPDGSSFAQTPSEGRVLDLLRRAAGLATPPPPCGAAVLQLISWLNVVLHATGVEQRRLGWDEVVMLHPATDTLVDCRPAVAQVLILLSAKEASWADFRRGPRHYPDRGLLPPPDLSAWMDDGMFARWVLADLPTVDELLPQVRPRVSADAYRGIRHLIHAVERASCEVDPPAA